MDTDAHRSNNLFDSMGDCCSVHQCDPGATPSDEDPTIDQNVERNVMLIVDEDFENSDTLPWVHGGLADWHITTSESVSGTHSMRSGDLNSQRNTSSDLTLKVDSSRGAFFKFSYMAEVSDPFDHFTFRVDGVVQHMDRSPFYDWRQYSLGIQPGPHELSFHVEAPAGSITIPRSTDPDSMGTGVVYIDDLQFTPL